MRTLPENKILIEKLIKIRTKRGEIVPFKLNVAQNYYWQRKTRRNLLLKARQKGLSKIIDADQLIDCIKKSTNALVLSHEEGATKRLFSAVRFYIKNMEAKPYVLINSQKEISFPKRDSNYFIATAGQKAAGRGDTLQRAHLSEAAHYYDLEMILAGVSEAAEYGQIDIETTANGRGHFYDMWNAAKEGRSPYTDIFIPWFIDDEYSVDNLTEQEKIGISEAFQKMISIPDDEFLAGMTVDEKRLRERVLKEWGILLTAGQMKWRRYKIWDKGALFWQEYPEDDVSCFLQSGRPVFSSIILEPWRQIPLDNLDSWKADDKTKAELLQKVFYGGIDGAEGTLTGDAHSFSVIDVQGSQGVVIYEYTSNEPIDVFYQKIKPVMEKFKIVLGIEKNGVGVAHIREATRIGFRFLPWETSGANRPIMITDLESAYRKGELIETYAAAENQARDMEYNQANRPEHKKGKHDDSIFSRSIAWQIRKLPIPGVSFV